jgi:peptide/nickel transport system ATP-binding protein
MAERVVVMYAGRKAEEAPVDSLFSAPQHPYTKGLLNSVPQLGETLKEHPRERLMEIPGMVPSLRTEIVGCAFAPRCPLATERCRAEAPALEEKRPAHIAACHHSDRVATL